MCLFFQDGFSNLCLDMDFKAECLMEKAEKLLKSRAEDGDTQAGYLLGHVYCEQVKFPCCIFVRLSAFRHRPAVRKRRDAVGVWIALMDF